MEKHKTLREMRKAKRLTCTQLAALIGVPIVTISRLERGERWAQPDVQRKVLIWAKGELHPLALTEPFIVKGDAQ
jgi:transcriptional regulator with XRE-family HTH domain